RGQSLVFTVVPLAQVVDDLRAVTEARQLARLPSPAQRAAQHQRKRPTLQRAAQRPYTPPPVLGQRQVGAPGVLSRQAPPGLAVAHQHDPRLLPPRPPSAPPVVAPPKNRLSCRWRRMPRWRSSRASQPRRKPPRDAPPPCAPEPFVTARRRSPPTVPLRRCCIRPRACS